MSKTPDTKTDTATALTEAPAVTPALSRRAALVRLGIGAGAAYLAPTLTQLDNTAEAATPPLWCPPSVNLPGCPPVPPGGGRRPPR